MLSTALNSSPTHGDNLLDLVISDILGKSMTSVVPPIDQSEHAIVITDFHAFTLQGENTSRTVWRYNLTSWPRLRAYFRQTDWTALVAPGHDPEFFCKAITNHIQQGMEQFIPSKNLTSPPLWSEMVGTRVLYPCPGQRQSQEEVATGCSQLHAQGNISRLCHRWISDNLPSSICLGLAHQIKAFHRKLA